RVVLRIDRAQDAAVDVTEFGRSDEAQTVLYVREAVIAVGVAAVASRGFEAAVQADADPDIQVLDRLQQGPVEESPIGLDSEVDVRRYRAPQQPGQLGQVSGPGQQRLTAV